MIDSVKSLVMNKHRDTITIIITVVLFRGYMLASAGDKPEVVPMATAAMTSLPSATPIPPTATKSQLPTGTAPTPATEQLPSPDSCIIKSRQTTRARRANP